MSKRVAILVGGGEVPGLNMCLKSLVYRLVEMGFEPLGVRKGWEGLIRFQPQDPTTYGDHFIELTKQIVRPIDRTSGSFLHASRLDPRVLPAAAAPGFMRTRGAETVDATPHILEVVKRLDLRGLIVIGDDDAVQYAAHLGRQGVPVIAIPKTIHNNIPTTDYTLGFSTGMARGVAFIHELRALAGSREQLIVAETFAANSGYSTLLMAFLAGADRVIIPEVAYNPEHLAHLLLQDKHETPANYAVLVACDGARLTEASRAKYQPLLETEASDSGGMPGLHRLVGSGMVAARLLEHITGQEVFLQPLTYLLRTGAPDGQDLLGAVNFALTAARLLHSEQFGRMAAFTAGEMWTHVDLQGAAASVKTVDVAASYDSERYKPRLSLIWSADET